MMTAFPGVPGTRHGRYDDHGYAHAQTRAGDIILAGLQAAPNGRVTTAQLEECFSARRTEGA